MAFNFFVSTDHIQGLDVYALIPYQHVRYVVWNHTPAQNYETLVVYITDGHEVRLYGRDADVFVDSFKEYLETSSAT